MRRSCIVFVLSLFVTVPVAASTPMWTWVVGLPIGFDDCKSRVSSALEQEGFGDFKDFGNGYVAFRDDVSASAGCIRGDGETVLSVVVAGEGDVKARCERIVSLVRGGGTRSGGGERPGDVTWASNASQYRGRNGQRVTLSCPGNGTIGSVWGTDVYTDDSSICSAAVHAGMITRSGGGTVTIEVAPGRASYAGTLRNGVTSSNYGAWNGSFVFAGSDTRPRRRDDAMAITWGANAAQWRGQNGQRIRVSCSGGGTFGSVWGTGVYTDDSSICTAAVHAGLITRAAGGTVTIAIRAGQASYTGSSRNGVTSGDYGSWNGSFVFQ